MFFILRQKIVQSFHFGIYSLFRVSVNRDWSRLVKDIMIFVLGGERHKYPGFVCDTSVLLYFITWGFAMSDPRKDSWSDRKSSKTWHHLLKHDQVHPDKKLQSLAVFTVANSHFRVAPQAQPFSLHFMCFQAFFWAWETSADPTNEEWFTCRNFFSQFFYSWAAGLT